MIKEQEFNQRRDCNRAYPDKIRLRGVGVLSLRKRTGFVEPRIDPLKQNELI